MNDECKLNGHNVHLERSAWKMRTSGIVSLYNFIIGVLSEFNRFCCFLFIFKIVFKYVFTDKHYFGQNWTKKYLLNYISDDNAVDVQTKINIKEETQSK
jgi:hypothetical protein